MEEQVKLAQESAKNSASDYKVTKLDDGTLLIQHRDGTEYKVNMNQSNEG